MNVSLRFLFISPFCSFINRTPDDFNQCDQDNVDQVSTMIALTSKIPYIIVGNLNLPPGKFSSLCCIGKKLTFLNMGFIPQAPCI